MSRPFDAARYAGLLEGLEATEIAWSKLERTKRIDPEYFLKHHLRNQAVLSYHALQSVADCAKVADGNHFAISDEFVEDGIPYYRGQDVSGQFFVEQALPMGISRKAFSAPFMKRSHLREGDVLLSIIGTIGESSLVSSNRDATCSCKLAILRPKKIVPAFLATYLRCEYGRSQTNRLTRGAVQMGLLLEDMDQLMVPVTSPVMQQAIEKIIFTAREQFDAAAAALADAERQLLSALGLENWQPPKPLSYVRRSRDAFAAGRLDAQYFQPKFDATAERLSKSFKLDTLGLLGQVLKGTTVPYSENGDIPIIRSGDLGNIDGDDKFLRSTSSEPIFFLVPGDVLISSIGFGSIGKVQVFDKPGRYGTVGEVTVVRQQRINPHYLAAFLRSSAGQLQIDRFITGATGQLHLYPRDVAKLWVPILPGNQQTEFEKFALQAARYRIRAAELLDAAKRAVELAIEDSEAAALQHLASFDLPANTAP